MDKTGRYQRGFVLSDTVLMVSPDRFGFNHETADSNPFQTPPEKIKLDPKKIQKAALKEFLEMVHTLKENKIEVLVLPSRQDLITPDAVFPNNWFSHHQDGTLVFYPMLTPNRRAERQVEALLKLLSESGIFITRILDLTEQERIGQILEGTGSLVLDRKNKVAFAMESPRTTKEAVDDFCEKMAYSEVFFRGYDKTNLPIYHTNVVVSIGDGYAIYCPDAIHDIRDKVLVENNLTDLAKELIPITMDQLYSFCANVLHVISKTGTPKIILSTTAFDAFDAKQKKTLQKYGELITVNIPTIEKVGGGSARCMMAEVFPAKELGF